MKKKEKKPKRQSMAQRTNDKKSFVVEKHQTKRRKFFTIKVGKTTVEVAVPHFFARTEIVVNNERVL